MRAVVLAMIAACGGAPDPQPAGGKATRAASSIATRTSASDEIVAQVNGRPVWASCVAAQGAKLGSPDPRKALDECIAFELLAQEADKRGLADDPEVVDATRTALVSRLVEVGFEAKYTKPTDLGDRLEKWLRDNAFRMHRPDLRASAYARVVLPPNAPADQDGAARALAESLHAKVASETGMFASDLIDAAKVPAPAGLTIETAIVGQKARPQLDPSYGDVLFSIPEVGRVGKPVRTPWGWDIVLWTGGLPPQEMTRDEIAASAFPELRRSMFPIWVAQIQRDLGVKVEIDAAQVARLDEVGP